MVNMISSQNNFNYSLIRNNTYVKETNKTNKKNNNIWSIKELCLIESVFNVKNHRELIEWAQSFKRTKKWLQENHPELMI